MSQSEQAEWRVGSHRYPAFKQVIDQTIDGVHRVQSRPPSDKTPLTWLALTDVVGLHDQYTPLRGTYSSSDPFATQIREPRRLLLRSD